jgi:hypothetical protein
MTYATYKIIGTELIPSEVFLGDASTPVWHQAKWSEGEYEEFVRKNGCGHCCAAMALNLHGIKITPHEEFTLCRKLWGEPNREQEFPQGNYQTVQGIAKILRHHGVPAECFGVPTREHAAAHIESVLREGKQVIFWSAPREDFPENPFSTGAHYVMAVGYTEKGEILIANSSQKKAPIGVQTVDVDTIAKALYLGADPTDKTWGEKGDHIHCAGYVVVG